MIPATKSAATKKAASKKKAAPKKKVHKNVAKKKPQTTLPLKRDRVHGKPEKKATSAKKVAETVIDPGPKKKQTKTSESPVSSIRIRLSAFDHVVLDEATAKIVDTAQRSGAVIHGPVPLPTKIRKFTVNRSTFVHKDARDQFEMRTHRRLIDLTETTFKTIDSLQNLSLPSGVDIEIKMG